MISVVVPGNPNGIGFVNWTVLVQQALHGKHKLDNNMLEMRVTFYMEEKNPDVALWVSEIVGSLQSCGVANPDQIVWISARALPNLRHQEELTTIQLKEYWADGKVTNWDRNR